MFYLKFRTCFKQVGEIQVPDEQAYDYWWMYAQALLEGRNLNVSVPDAPADAQIEQVTLMKANDIDINAAALPIASVFLLCGADHHKDEKPNPASRLILPQGVSLTSS